MKEVKIDETQLRSDEEYSRVFYVIASSTPPSLLSPFSVSVLNLFYSFLSLAVYAEVSGTISFPSKYVHTRLVCRVQSCKP